MDDRTRKSQQAFEALFQGLCDLWLQELLGDKAMNQFGSKPKDKSQIASFDSYRVLGLQKTDPDDAVKKRYRELCMKLHPDTAGVKGTEFLFQLVQMAYQQISRQRGWIR